MITALLATFLVWTLFNLVRFVVVGTVDIDVLIAYGSKAYEQLPPHDDMIYNPKYWNLWTFDHWVEWLRRKGAL